MMLLEGKNVQAFYGDFHALFGVDLTLQTGELIGVVGANGAGKSTLLRRLSGLKHGAPESVLLDGKPIGNLRADQVAKLGIALVPEGRRLFSSLSVEENLRMGLCAGRSGYWTLPRVYQLFPILGERKDSPATMLSGGQQQMCAIGRALLCNPRVLLCDELSLGLAPTIIKDIYNALPTILAEGTSMLIVEQDVAQAMSVCHRIYCMREGRVVLQGAPQFLSRSEITAAYFGTQAAAS
jgi:branched-chain amino acid transport system ATP-binding protein